MTTWTSKPQPVETGEASDRWASPALVADLLGAIHGVDDDQRVQITAGTLRSLLAAVERDGMTETPGVAIHDAEKAVTYVVAVAGAEGRVWPASVQVVLDDPTQQPDPSVWRLPAQRLAERAALDLARWSDAPAEADSDSLVIVTDSRPGPPSTEELAALVAAGESRRTLAVRFDRSVVTVDGWLAKARRERPDLFPAARRGPKPGGST